MPRHNRIQTRRLQMTIDSTTDRLIGQMVGLGIHGANRAEVACSIIRQWLWDNQQKLRENGVAISAAIKGPRKQ